MRRSTHAAVAAAATLATRAALGRVDALERGLRRQNFRGADVSLLEGPALVAGLATTGGPAYLIAALGAGGAGLLDDVAGSGSSRGLRGHLAALRRGEVTTGTVKIAALAATGMAAAAAGGRPGAVRVLVDGALIAGSANLANLFDLRPGRALKASAAVAVPLAAAGSAASAGVLGAGAAVLAEDLAGSTMMGDTGANALGAVLGAAAAAHLHRPGRLLALAVVVALTLASEKVSFSAVIADSPVLRRMDDWGRA